MRTIISIIFFTALTTLSLAQRVEFNDPDLSFSIKKPRNWQVFDDGYVVKLSPSAMDSSSIFLSVTYFSTPEPLGGYSSSEFPEAIEVISQPAPQIKGPSLKIAGRMVQPSQAVYQKENDPLNVKLYAFYEKGQRWEILTSAPNSEEWEFEKAFRKILKSLRIN